MAYTAEELAGKKVAELRDIAKDIDHEALGGYSSMRKDELIEALLAAQGGKASKPAASPRKSPKKKAAPAGPSKRRAAKRLSAKGLDKAGIKALIQSLKSDRAEALTAGDHDRLRIIRRQMHHLKRKARQTAAVERAAAEAAQAAAAAATTEEAGASEASV